MVDKYIEVHVGSRKVKILVEKDLYAHYMNQFQRPKTTKQEMRLRTLRDLMRAAYLQGLEEGKKRET